MNLRDAESAYMDGRVKFQEWLDEFYAKWYEPLYKTQLALLLSSLTQEELMLPGMETVIETTKQLLGGGNYASANQTNWLEISRQRIVPRSPQPELSDQTPT